MANFKKLVALMLATTLVISSLSPMATFAEISTESSAKETSNLETNNDSNQRYTEILSQYAALGAQAAEGDVIELDLSTVTSSKEVVPKFEKVFEQDDTKSLMWTAQEEYFEWNVELAESGLYNIEVEYALTGNRTANVQRTLLIDGEPPFSDANGLIFRGLYREDGEVRVNNIGEDVRPRIVGAEKFAKMLLESPRGLYNEPFKFLLGGEHTIRLKFDEGSLAIKAIRFIPTKGSVSYSEYMSKYDGIKKYTGDQVTIQAEDAILRNDETLRREYSTDPACEPYRFGYRTLNIIGDARYNAPGQSLTWSISVNESGLYKLGFHVYQGWNDGLPSARRIMIDGEVPFKELNSYSFAYSQKWQTASLSDDEGEDFLFYFEKDKSYELSMMVVLDYAGGSILLMEETIEKMIAVYREIKKITGPEPDIYFDYQFEKNIPNLVEKLTDIDADVSTVIERFNQVSMKNSAMVSNFDRIRDTIARMLKDPFTISQVIEDFYYHASDASFWISDIAFQPLAIDNIMLTAPDKDYVIKKTSPLDKIKAFILSFIMSFFKDYDNVGYTESGEETKTLEVWVGRNNEWAEIMKDIADEHFTPKFNIGLKINVVPAGQLSTGANPLLVSVASGRAPDVVVGAEQNMPSEFAIRGAVLDISKFDGFEELRDLFYPSTFVPIEYDGGVYGLPETTDFTLLFYRKDIMAELSLEIPKTWDELTKTTLPVLKQNNMDFFYSLGLNMFMFQYDAQYYSDGARTSALDSDNSYKAFSLWTSLYTDFDVPIGINFFSRFRSGEIPLAIAGYNEYMLIKSAAPELLGKWGVAEIPGVLKEDGSVYNPSSKFASTFVSIMSDTEYPEECYEFIRWWTSTEIQSLYAITIESIIGTEGRYCPANRDAFDSLSWGDDYNIIKNTLDKAMERPMVLGGFYTDKHIANSQNRVIISGMKPRDSLRILKKDIDRELYSKRKEFGFE